MDDEFDKFVQELQEEIDQEVRENFSPNALDLIKNKYNWGKLNDANATSRYTGPCGDTMEFFLKINNEGIINDARFQTNGCNPTIASGSQTTLLIIGKTIENAKSLTSDDIMKAIGKLPPENSHCPELANRALKKALDDYDSKKK